MRAAIRAFNLGKKYLRAPETESRLIARFRRRREGVPVWALRNCTFDVQCGDLVGIIGANGAGKSTLLKLLSRITRPNEGQAEVYGGVGALLEVGTGFHPELTGRENVYLNGALIGMQKSEIRRNFDSIVDFAGVADWLDTPIKRYSSGMKVRLAFAVAAHLEQEIMIIDEVLAVGDSGFRRQCLKKIAEMTQHQGRAVLLVSHELPAVASMCSRAIWLETGHVRAEGIASEVIGNYLSTIMSDGRAGRGFLPLRDPCGDGDGLALRYIRLLDADDKQVPCFVSGETAKFAIGFHATDSNLLLQTDMNLTIYNMQRQALTICKSTPLGSAEGSPPNPGEFRCEIQNLPLVPGQYSIDISYKFGQKPLSRIMNAGDFLVVLGTESAARPMPQAGEGDVFVDHHWSIGGIQ